MNNEIFINEMKNYYESLQYFNLENNYLVLNYEGIFKIPFVNVTLSSLNPNLFSLDPKEIFHILYMLELLPKDTLNNNEVEFINGYVSRYLKINDLALENDGMDSNLAWGLSIPIYTSYDPLYLNKPGSKIIEDSLNSHTENLSEGRGNHQKLVLLKNDNFSTISEDEPITNLAQAGFTTLVLIFIAVAATVLYIANFIIVN